MGILRVIGGSIGNGIIRPIELDSMTNVLRIISDAHHEIHEGDSFTAYYTRTTDSADGHRSGIYIKTPAIMPLCHMIVSFSASTAANYSILEAPTIAVDIGTHSNVIYNRYRDSAKISGCFDNDSPAIVNRFTTLTEDQIDGDITWALGTVLRTEPLEIGSGPKPAGGVSRDTEEYVLAADTIYVFLITNTAASANIHHILIDWYEHTNSN